MFESSTNNVEPASPASSTNSDMNLLLATPTKPSVTQNELDIMETRTSPSACHNSTNNINRKTNLSRTYIDDYVIHKTCTATVTSKSTSTNNSNSNSPKTGSPSMKSIKNDVRLFSPENKGLLHRTPMLTMLTQRQLQQAGVRNAMISADLIGLSPEHVPQMDHNGIYRFFFVFFICFVNN
jgi:hypothetical protein